MVCRDALSRQSYTLWFQRCSLSHDYVSPLLSSNEYYLLYCTLLHSGSGLALCPWLWFMVGNWIRKCQLHLLSMSCIQCVRRDHLFGLLWGYAPTKQSAEIDGENRKRSTSSKVSIKEESNIAQDIELYSGIQGELLATTQEKRCGRWKKPRGEIWRVFPTWWIKNFMNTIQDP